VKERGFRAEKRPKRLTIYASVTGNSIHHSDQLYIPTSCQGHARSKVYKKACPMRLFELVFPCSESPLFKKLFEGLFQTVSNFPEAMENSYRQWGPVILTPRCLA